MPANSPDADDYWEREMAEQEADRLRKAEPPPKLSRDEFLAWRSPRHASLNPSRLDNALWHWLVRTRWDGYNANELYAGPSSFDAGPMWSFQRFGKSETPLDDGRIIHIGGEHEDHYDPDFFIYNDVVVVHPDGDIAIYGYPVADFPPTDFHSATRIGEAVFIIGALGYPDQRVLGTTPVYRLSLDSMRIGPVETRGEPPGWISRHSAALHKDGQSIIVSGGERWTGNDRPLCENIDSWSLNTASGEWRRLTRRNWQRWTIQRLDGKRSRLWDVRQARWNRDHAHLGLKSYWTFDDAPDFEALEMLYRLDEATPPPTEGPGLHVFAVVVDGLTVRFKEDDFWVEAIVEGELAQERLHSLQSTTLALVERLEAAACKIERSHDDGLPG